MYDAYREAVSSNCIEHLRIPHQYNLLRKVI